MPSQMDFGRCTTLRGSTWGLLFNRRGRSRSSYLLLSRSITQEKNTVYVLEYGVQAIGFGNYLATKRGAAVIMYVYKYMDILHKHKYM
jgi:hypothetical protein